MTKKKWKVRIFAEPIDLFVEANTKEEAECLGLKNCNEEFDVSLVEAWQELKQGRMKKQ